MTDCVVIVGGGPAGSAVARRLAFAGRRAVMLTGPTTAGYEGLSSRSRQLLHEEGVAVDAGLLAGPLQRSGEWGEGRRVAGTEWLVDRVALATAMRAAAADGGAEVYEDAVASIEPEGATVKVVSRRGVKLEASCVIDARGRRGAEIHGPKILAIGQRFEFAEPAPEGTSLHPLSFGWCWLVSRGRERWMQVAARPGDGRPHDWLSRATAEDPSLARALAGARRTGPPVSRAAHARRSVAPAARGLIRTGDAAVGLDPLSGQGVYEALRGARVAAAAALSLLEGAEPAIVHQFLDERHDAIWQRAVATAAAFYEENVARGPFWSATAAAYRTLIAAAPSRPDLIERRPVLDGDRIRLQDVLVTAAHPRGIWQVDGVPVVDLIRYLQRADRPSPAQAAAVLSRPPAAIAAATRFLREAGAWPLRPAHDAYVPGG